MRRLIGWLGLLALALACLTPATPAAAGPLGQTGRTAARDLRGQYIVTLKPDVRAAALLKTEGIAARFVYTRAVNGFAARLTPAQLAALSRHPAVALIEPDAALELPEGSQPSSGGAGIMAAPWNLDRIDQQYLPLSGTYTTLSNGANSNVYIFGTGIKTSLPDFSGRAFVAYDALGGTGQDCNGNGTYVAGIVGSTTYGVAKGARLWSVRHLDCSGSGTVSGYISALDWVRANHQPRAIAVLTAGGAASSALNSAIVNMINANVFTVVPASTGSTSCSGTLAAITQTLATAVSNAADKAAGGEGSCVDVYAPGVSVTSNGLSGPVTLSSLVAGAPHVAGVAALYKATYGEQLSSTVHSWIVSTATPGVLTSVPPGTPNRLLYTAGL